MPVAVNDKGDVLSLDASGQWTPAKIAQNPQTGEKLYADGNEWKPLPVKSPGMLQGLSDAAAKGATFGFSDEVGAAGQALVDTAFQLGKGEPVTIGKNYDEAIARKRGSAQAFTGEHPILSTAAEVMGGMGSAGPGTAKAITAAVPKLWDAIKTSATVGGVQGTVSGFGNAEGSPEERLPEAAVGGFTGAVTGASFPLLVELGTKGISAVRNAVGMQDPAKTARDLILRAMGRDGIDPQEAVTRLKDWAANGAKPAALFDLGGENVRGLARASAGTPGPAKQTAVEFLQNRQGGQAERIAGDVASTISPNSNYYGTIDSLMQKRKADAAPLYEASNAKQFVWDEGLSKLADRPSMRQAMGRAARIAAEEDRNPNGLGLTLDADGNAKLTSAPSAQTVDYIKRGLDDVLEAYRDKTTGKLVLDEAGRAIDATRREFLKQADALNPEFKAARAAWSGPSQSLDALALGREVLKRDSEITTKQIADMSPGDREFFKAGVVRALKDLADNAKDGADVTKRIFGSEAVRNKLRAAFDTDADFNRFADAIKRERALYTNAQNVSPRANSRTTPMAEEIADLNDSPTLTFARDVAAQPTGASMVVAAGKAGMGRLKGLNDATTSQLADMLFTSDPRNIGRTAIELNRRRLGNERGMAKQNAMIDLLVRGAVQGEN